jgi:hypothetical protein
MRWCRLTGLHLLGVLLAQNYPLYDKLHDSHISESVWYEKLLNNLSGPKKVYSLCAEVVGLALGLNRSRSIESPPPPPPLESLVRDRITAMFSKEEHTRALDCLSHVAKYYPAFVDPFFLRIFDQIKRFTSEAKITALHLILMRLDDLNLNVVDIFKNLQPRLYELLQHRFARLSSFIHSFIHSFIFKNKKVVCICFH